AAPTTTAAPDETLTQNCPPQLPWAAPATIVRTPAPRSGTARMVSTIGTALEVVQLVVACGGGSSAVEATSTGAGGLRTKAYEQPGAQASTDGARTIVVKALERDARVIAAIHLPATRGKAFDHS